MSRHAAVVQVHQDLSAPAPAVWRAVMDWEAQGQWMLGTTVQVTGGDGQSVGSQLRAYSGRRPFGFADTMVISEWDPPRRCVVRHTGTLVRGQGIFLVEPRGQHAARLIWREELELPWGRVGALGWPLARPAFLLGLRRSLRRFADRQGFAGGTGGG